MIDGILEEEEEMVFVVDGGNLLFYSIPTFTLLLHFMATCVRRAGGRGRVSEP